MRREIGMGDRHKEHDDDDKLTKDKEDEWEADKYD